MNGRVAKRLRKAAYGDLSLKGRKHFHNPRVHGTIIADERHQAYQAMKAAYKRGDLKL
jgi:hypothetical protein